MLGQWLPQRKASEPVQIAPLTGADVGRLDLGWRSLFTPEELRAQVDAEPGLNVIVRRRLRDARPVPDPRLARAAEVRNGDVVFELYRPASR